ncbi:unnamed protein product [Lymnaea stagnalis]|uniref:ShKT domain-containing protein n=1 Tax=Lymnaea stagnalis TaxID=6523 RepID=A0AAV2I4S8_LYMST
MAEEKVILLLRGLSLLFIVYFVEVNGITISVGSEAECKDAIQNCREYGADTCSGLYLSWAKSNCAATCGICTPSLTTEAPACVDHLTNCYTYQGDICTNAVYRGWAEGNCRKFCRFCTESQLSLLDSQTTTQATIKSPAGCYDKFKCESFGSIACSIEKYGNWGQMNCPVYCGFCQGTTPTTTMAAPCVDTRPDCSTFQEDTCTNSLYKNWAESNCRKFCKFCGAAQDTTPMPSSTSTPCVDAKPDCATFQDDTCTNPSFKSWAETNCRKFCKLCGTNQLMQSTQYPSTTKAPPSITTTKASPPSVITTKVLPPITTTRTFSIVSTTTKAPPPITTTKSPPHVTTTKTPPHVTTTKSPPPFTTTKAPSLIITTKATPQVITTKATPQVITTKAPPPIMTTGALPLIATTKAPPPVSTTRALPTTIHHSITMTAVHLPPTFKTPPPLIKTPPPLLGQ